MTDPIVEHSRRMIRDGSKSFAGAARLMAPSTRSSVYMLYAWCRHCDDRIDLQDLGRSGPESDSTGRERLRELVRETRRALAGQAAGDPAFVALQRVVRRHRIPHEHPLELLRGLEMDVEGRTYRSIEDTLDYCYHVAGVVGVMMAHVMGVRDPRAFDRAADLGMALQMTNIARDVIEDARAGRIYLPQDWLAEAGIPPGEIADARHRAALSGVVGRLLVEADRYYRSADRGLPWLDLRCAWAVATARGVYRDIGVLVRRRAETAWDSRTYVGPARKVYRVLGGAVDAVLVTMLGARAGTGSREGLWTRPGGSV